MYRYSIIFALLAAATIIQANPLHLFSRPSDGLIGDETASDMTNAKRSESSINGDIGAGIVARDDEDLVGPFDVDGALPVAVGGSIVDI